MACDVAGPNLPLSRESPDATAPGDHGNLNQGGTQVAGKKFGFVMAEKVPGSYFSLSEAERDEPGRVFETLLGKYAGKVELVRRYWTRSFSAEVTDVFVMECDDMMDMHNLTQELHEMMGASGLDPDRFGKEVSIWAGVNPDA